MVAQSNGAYAYGENYLVTQFNNKQEKWNNFHAASGTKLSRPAKVLKKLAVLIHKPGTFYAGEFS